MKRGEPSLLEGGSLSIDSNFYKLFCLEWLTGWLVNCQHVAAWPALALACVQKV